MAARSMREKLRKRRENTQDTLIDQDDEDDDMGESKRSKPGLGRTTGPDLSMTWDAAVAELTATTGSELSDQEIIEEIHNAETLQEDLKTKHRDRKRELKASLRSRREEDLKDQLQTAKSRSRDKLSQSQRMRADASETIDGGEEMIQATSASRDEAEMSGPMAARRGSKEPLLDTGEDGELDTTGPGKRKNLQATIRERLRSKVKTARDKAESEVLEETAGRRRLRGLRDKPTTTRFDDATVDARTAKFMQGRWQSAVTQLVSAKKSTRAVSIEEAMDFFCRDWPPEPETPPAEVATPEVKEEDKPEVKEEEKGEGEEEGKEKTEGEEEKPEGEDGEPKPGTSAEGEDKKEKAEGEVEEIKEEGGEEEGKKDKKKDKKEKKEDEMPLLMNEVDEYDEWGYVAVRKAEYTSYKDKQEKEKKEFYIPSMIAIPDEKKIDENLQPRYLAEEGIYVGTRPPVTHRNENKLESRLLNEPDGLGRKWFGEDGKVQVLPDPLKQIPTRPMMMDDPNPLIDTVYCKAITKEFDSKYIDGRVDLLGKRYQLDVDLNQVTFTHHHLFSREHVLASRLRSLYIEYTKRCRNDIVTYYSEKLKALKQATLHIREAIVLHKNSDKPSNFMADQERRLKDYTNEIKMVRQERDGEQGHDRRLMKNIIKTWKEIRHTRQLLTCTNTSVKLRIRRELTDASMEEADWLAEIEDEVDELKLEHQEDFIKKQSLYNELLEKHTAQQTAKKEAKKRQKKREKKKVQDMTEGELEEEITDTQIIAEDEIKLPDPPAGCNETETRELITSKAKRIRRYPGEPKLFPELLDGASITPTNQCPRAEKARRDDVNRYKCFVKVFVNNKEVARTQAKPLGQDFTVMYGRILNVQIVFWPESVRLEIYESAGFSVDLLAELYMAIPEQSQTSLSVQLEEMDFSSEQSVAHKHEGIGSGTLFSFDAEGTNLVSLMTTGQLATSICWAVEESGAPMVPPSQAGAGAMGAFKNYDAIGVLGAAGSVDMEKLTKWIAESRMDPNDPRNADLVYLMKPGNTGDDVTGGAFRMPDYFRLEQLQEEFDFVSDEQMEVDLRFRLIQYRDQEVLEFRNYKMIPSYAKDIPLDIFKEYEKKQSESSLDRIRDIESHRAQVQRFMQQVRETVLRRFRILSHQKSFSSMVVEEDVPQIGTLLPTLLKATEVRRPLRPIRKERKKVTAQNLDGIDVKILVNIIRAYDVPIRTDGTAKEADQKRGVVIPFFKKDLVRPCVEILFQHETYTTSVADGPNPSWNEEIQIPFRPPNNDISPSNLQTVKDVFYINLFDHVEIDVLEDERQRKTNVAHRIERNYLGSLKLPFSTLYLNSKVEGTFCVGMPPVLLGYTHQTKATKTDTTGLGGDIEIGIGDTDQTYLTVFVTIEPQLALPEPVREKFDSNEDEKLLEAADLWLYDLEQKYPKREFRATVTDINGRTVFGTRYFRPLKPPTDVLENEGLKMSPEERVARYVSLIPFVADSLVFPGLCDIWSTCDQFMNMLAGDEEEHAVLLMNYFLHLEKKVWLVIGLAIPEGPTAYVLTEEENKDYWLWNASTGEHFSYKNNYCPLKGIGCLMNADNVWANTQSSDEPWRLSFDLSAANNWRPFFTPRFPHPGLSSVQPATLDYLRTEKAYVGDLQDKIERSLREKMMQWRPRNITRWNRYCMQAFRQLLVKFEENGGASMRNQPITELDQILKTYKMTGFPINLPFTEIEPIIDSVYATGLHDIDSNDVEFALAVYIAPYPNSILSVWVYVASLVRKR